MFWMSWRFCGLISIVVIGPLILSFDGVQQLAIKQFIHFLIFQVSHNLYFGNKPSCWSSPSTATDKTSLITFASDSVSLFGPVMMLEGQSFWSCNHFGANHQSVGISCGLHPLGATSARFSFVGIYRHWMQPSFVSLSPCCSQTARSLFYLSCKEMQWNCQSIHRCFKKVFLLKLI